VLPREGGRIKKCGRGHPLRRCGVFSGAYLGFTEKNDPWKGLIFEKKKGQKSKGE